MINLNRDLFISLPRLELSESLFSKTSLRLKSNLILKLGLIIKSNLTLKLGFVLKSKLVLKLVLMLKFVHIQNFELILDILDHLKPSIFCLKQSGRLAACYLEKNSNGWSCSVATFVLKTKGKCSALS